MPILSYIFLHPPRDRHMNADLGMQCTDFFRLHTNTVATANARNLAFTTEGNLCTKAGLYTLLDNLRIPIVTRARILFQRPALCALRITCLLLVISKILALIIANVGQVINVVKCFFCFFSIIFPESARCNILVWVNRRNSRNSVDIILNSCLNAKG